MVKLNVDIPDDIWERMSSFDEDWPRVAIRAFQSRMEELSDSRENRAIDKRKIYNSGVRNGEYWARHSASPYEINRIPDVMKVINSDELLSRTWWTGDYKLSELFVFVLHPNCEGDIQEVERFWKRAVSEDDKDMIDDEEFLKGFAEGVLAVFPDQL